eukprot:SAG31_NODE_1834_length_7135_cov_6.903923_2_plen_80_part_00
MVAGQPVESHGWPGSASKHEGGAGPNDNRSDWAKKNSDFLIGTRFRTITKFRYLNLHVYTGYKLVQLYPDVGIYFSTAL